MNLSPHLQRAIEMELKDAYLKGREDERKKQEQEWSARLDKAFAGSGTILAVPS